MQLMSHRIIEIRNGKDALSHLVDPLTVQDCSLQCIFIFSNALYSPDLNVSRDRASTNSFRGLLHGPAALTLWKIFLLRTRASFFSHFHFCSSATFYQLKWFPSSLLIFILYISSCPLLWYCLHKLYTFSFHASLRAQLFLSSPLIILCCSLRTPSTLSASFW